MPVGHPASQPPLARISKDCYGASLNLTFLSHGEKSERWKRMMEQNSDAYHALAFATSSWSLLVWVLSTWSLKLRTNKVILMWHNCTVTTNQKGYDNVQARDNTMGFWRCNLVQLMLELHCCSSENLSYCFVKKKHMPQVIWKRYLPVANITS